MSKKLIIVITSIVFVLAIIITGSLIIFNNASDCIIKIGNVQGKKGEIVAVPIEITKNPGILAFIIQLDYDETDVKCVGIDKGDFISVCETNISNSTVKILNFEEKTYTDTGDLFYARFEILSDEKSKTEIFINPDNTSICIDEKTLANFTSNNGKIKIK